MPSFSRATSQAATRAALVEAAEALLRETSYAELTVRAIAARAGFTTGAFFAHFPSKAELVLELITRSRSETMEFLLEAFDAAWAAHDDEYASQLLVARTEQIYDETVIMLDVLTQAMRDPELAPRVGALMSGTVTVFSSLEVFASISEARRAEVAAQVLALFQGLLLQSIGQPDLDVAVLFARGARSLLNGAS